MSNNIDMDKLLLELNELESEFRLTPADKELIQNNPGILPEIWGDTSKAIMLHHFREIMGAQVAKAKKGDTAAAKFLIDFANPGEISGEIAGENPWEDAAIYLRDKLGLELSAETFVALVLESLTNIHIGRLRRILNLTQDKLPD